MVVDSMDQFKGKIGDQKVVSFAVFDTFQYFILVVVRYLVFWK